MRLLSLLFAAILASAFTLAAVSESDEKPKSKPRGGFVTPTPRPKSAKSADDAEPNSTTPKPRKKSTPSATPKAKPNAAVDTASEKPEAKATPAPKDDAAKPSATIQPPAGGATGKSPASSFERAPAATLDPDDLREFATQPPRVQQLIKAGLELTKLNLTYTYGSADPANGGMDCSGTMYHLLRAQGFPDVPRDSSGQYVWARKRGLFFAVVGKKAESFEFDDLLPGDLLFWTGTYEVQREIPISHVMLYLGTEKKTKRRVMFGASDGRTYAGIQRWGVSVFDFKMPREAASGEGARVDFVGYARIPALRDAAGLAAVENATAKDEEVEKPAPPAAVTPAPKSTGKKSAKAGTSKSATPTSKKKSSPRAE